jgi:signal transduction histidine kinase
MLRSAGIFLAAILLPSLMLAWLAVRSAHDQEIVQQHQQAIICQDVTDNLAKSVRSQVDLIRSEFVQITQDLVSKSASPQAAAATFDRVLRAQWPPAEIGFAVDLGAATIYSPGRNDGNAARMFYEENERFLTNREFVQVYPSFNSQSLVARQTEPLPQSQAGLTATITKNTITLAPTQTQAASPAADLLQNQFANDTGRAADNSSGAQFNSAAVDSLDESMQQKSMQAKGGGAATRRQSLAQDQATGMESAAKSASARLMPAEKATADQTDALQAPATLSVPTAAAAPAMNASSVQIETPTLQSEITQNQSALPQKMSQMVRNVAPQNGINTDANALSSTVPLESDFRRLIGSDTSGVLARFLDNTMRLMVWYRRSATDNLVFGAQLDQARVVERLEQMLQTSEFTKDRNNYTTGSVNYILVLLDDTGKPVARSMDGFETDWKHPFAATEIGDALPHWEAALYLTDPDQITKSANTLRLTVSLIVLLLVVAIVAGGTLIANDVRRQMRLAQQKTDFVSNVSHELKTPLTSIRMFADLLAEGRVEEPERQSTYLKIISAESARLTRLINNVLDFARLERGAPGGERRQCDLTEIARDVVETCLPHLEANGQNLTCEIEADTLPIVGDRDALAQIILNLISNAEKYGGGEILVRVRRQETPGGALGCVDVLDRGPGIPPKQVEAIFLPFHRLHDSLSSGIPGSGLGLTLARRMARAHRGNITYAARAGGGSCFTLALPVAASSS